MSLGLAIADNGDGTGGVATVTGSVGALTTVYYATFSGSMGSLTWTSAGSRTGDGTLALSLPVGYYLWHAQTATLFSNTDSAVSGCHASPERIRKNVRQPSLPHPIFS